MDYPFLPHTDEEIVQMLESIGLKQIDDLYSDVPVLLKEELNKNKKHVIYTRYMGYHGYKLLMFLLEKYKFDYSGTEEKDFNPNAKVIVMCKMKQIGNVQHLHILDGGLKNIPYIIDMFYKSVIINLIILIYI